MHRSLGWFALAAFALTGSTAPATDASPVADALRYQMQSAAKNFVAAAEEMPADKYGYKPTPKHMSFAQHMLHMADFNETMCSLIGGAAVPAHAKLAATAPKDALVANLKSSFTYCSSALASVSDAGLGTMVDFYGSKITKASAVLILSGDWSDHYAVSATYLRLNGLLPPTARP